MSPGKTPTKFHTQVYEEASNWLVRFRTGPFSKKDKKIFDAWLRGSPERIQAYLEVSAIWEEIALLVPQSSASAAELIARAKDENPVFSLRNACEPSTDRQGSLRVSRETPAVMDLDQWRPRRALRIAASLAALTVICAALAAWWTRAPTYVTGVGEQRSITLADGSIVHLNARSEIRVNFLPHQRKVALLRGQALFNVAKDAARPFLVRAGSTRIQVVGTQFDVNESSAGTFITVVAGRVAVFGPQVSRMRAALAGSTSPIPSHGEDSVDLLEGLPAHVKPVFLSAKEQLTVTAHSAAEMQRVNVANITAWTERRFVFEEAPLAEVLDEFNRYSARALVLTDPQLADLRINAVFSSPNPSLLVRFLRAQPGVAVTDTKRDIRISGRQSTD